MSTEQARQADFYAELVRTSQAHPGYLAERDRWLRGLKVGGREGLLFELEMLLRGIERSFNLHNLPEVSGQPVLTRDFRPELEVLERTLGAAIALARRLLEPETDQRLVFRKWVETRLRDDSARRAMLEAELDQDSPQESLFVLRQSLGALRTIIGQLLRLPHCGYALYGEIGNLALREIVLNRFFRPFRPLEFRIEYDRLPSPALLDALRLLSPLVRQAWTVALFGLFRLLRYSEQLGPRGNHAALRGVLVPLIHGEGQSLLAFVEGPLKRRIEGEHREAAETLARRLEAALWELAHPADAPANRVDPEPADGALGPQGEDEAPSDGGDVGDGGPGDLDDDAASGASAVSSTAVERLGAEVRHQLLALSALLCGPEAPRDFDALTSRATRAQSLRVQLWVLSALCIRADRALARPGSPEAVLAHDALRRFSAYFYDVGFQLLRYGDLEPLGSYLGMLVELPQPPTGEAAALRLAEDCRRLARLVEGLFGKVGRRVELGGRPFEVGEAKALMERLGLRSA